MTTGSRELYKYKDCDGKNRNQNQEITTKLENILNELHTS